jgi:hypothetical protein
MKFFIFGHIHSVLSSIPLSLLYLHITSIFFLKYFLPPGFPSYFNIVPFTLAISNRVGYPRTKIPGTPVIPDDFLLGPASGNNPILCPIIRNTHSHPDNP